ncbi:hypothetical protein LX36DRAFT_659490 [Colletotrichum falcatum]|nr:hypothetical protein LX36DRAFT_659490 [Colletotrichum falcatum]
MLLGAVKLCHVQPLPPSAWPSFSACMRVASLSFAPSTISAGPGAAGQKLGKPRGDGNRHTPRPASRVLPAKSQAGHRLR